MLRTEVKNDAQTGKPVLDQSCQVAKSAGIRRCREPLPGGRWLPEQIQVCADSISGICHQYE